MNRTRLVRLLPWVLLVACVGGWVARETIWYTREAKAVEVEQLIRRISSAGSDADERAALTALHQRLQFLSLSASDRTTGQKMPMATVVDEGDTNTVFELGVDTDGDHQPDHFYQIVLKDPSNIGLLMFE